MPTFTMEFVGGYAYVFSPSRNEVVVASIRGDLQGLPIGYKEHILRPVLTSGTISGESTVGASPSGSLLSFSGWNVEVWPDGVSVGAPDLEIGQADSAPPQGGPGDWANWAYVLDLQARHSVGLLANWRDLVSAQVRLATGALRPCGGVTGIVVTQDGDAKGVPVATRVRYSVDFHAFVDIRLSNGVRSELVRLAPVGGVVQIVAGDPNDHLIPNADEDDSRAHYCLIEPVAQGNRIVLDYTRVLGLVVPGESCVPAMFVMS